MARVDGNEDEMGICAILVVALFIVVI